MEELPDIDYSLDTEEFDFELDGFTLDLDSQDNTENTFCKPRLLKPKCVVYDNAKALSAELILQSDAHYFCVISGNFIFGDLIEALILDKILRVEELTICTLSMSENNVDSLVNIMLSGNVKKLRLVVSSYFYAHERSGLIKYIYQELESKPWDFVFSVARTHMKMCMIKTDDLYITLQGSANLRSSDNIEQFSLIENKELYDFSDSVITAIEDSYAINRKEGERGNKLWQRVVKQAAQ